MTNRTRPGFTLVEMLVVVSIIGLLLGILLPAIGKARDEAKVTQSKSNLKNIGHALQTYSSEWGDRHLTYVVDEFQTYGPNPVSAAQAYQVQHGQDPPGIGLGWATDPCSGNTGFYQFHINETFGSEPNMMPLAFVDTPGSNPANPLEAGKGWYRYLNAKSLHDYLSMRFYDPVFYAPKDEHVVDLAEEAMASPEEFFPTCQSDCTGPCSDGIWFSSYSLSPAALYSPAVMRNEADGGWQDPWTLPAGFRVPSISQAQFPSLKTHVMEQHWLQNKRGPRCIPDFDPNDSLYGACQPYFFNGDGESSPVTLFYDGHIDQIGAGDAVRADGQSFSQSGYGLWSRDTPLGDNGFFISSGYDIDSPNAAITSFHILTTDGIRGRDIIAN